MTESFEDQSMYVYIVFESFFDQVQTFLKVDAALKSEKRSYKQDTSMLQNQTTSH